MTTTLIDNIGLLVTNDPSNGDGSALGVVRDAAMVIEADRVMWVGGRAPAPEADSRIDLDPPDGGAGVRRQSQPPDLRGRPRGRVRVADGRNPLHRRRYCGDANSDA